MLYLVYAESAHYAGEGEYFVVEAECEVSASDAVADAAESFFYEQDYDQFVEENGQDAANEESFSSIVSIVRFDESHEYWQFNDEFTHV